MVSESEKIGKKSLEKRKSLLVSNKKTVFPVPTYGKVDEK